MNVKMIMVAALGAASFGLMQGASAAPLWSSSDCSSTSSRPCIDYNGTDHFIDGSPNDPTVWHGQPGSGAPFSFSGTTVLDCGTKGKITCNLALDGKVRFPDSNTVGIKVTNATVSGGLGCGLVTVGGFPWYIAPNSYHGPYTTPALPLGVSTTPPYIGSIGPIDVDVSFPFIHVSGGHMHDVTYNNVDTFSFGTGSLDKNIYYNDPTTDTPSGCKVSGDLKLQSPGTSLIIHP